MSRIVNSRLRKDRPVTNSFDVSIMHFLNSFAHRSLIFDALVVGITSKVLLTEAVIMAMFWWAWAKYGSKELQYRERLIFSLFAILFSLLVARVLAATLPFRLRPLNNPQLGFRLPYHVKALELINWSSFPSDHAAICFCFAASLWAISKPMSILAFFHAIFAICLPRIYMGIHYPTDVIAGAILGVAIALLSNNAGIRRMIARPALYGLDNYPAAFSALLFLSTFEIGEEFRSLQDIATAGFHALRIVLHGSF
jgi:undecaprenyl-diphosphatase